MTASFIRRDWILRTLRNRWSSLRWRCGAVRCIINLDEETSWWRSYSRMVFGGRWRCLYSRPKLTPMVLTRDCCIWCFTYCFVLNRIVIQKFCMGRAGIHAQICVDKGRCDIHMIIDTVLVDHDLDLDHYNTIKQALKVYRRKLYLISSTCNGRFFNSVSCALWLVSCDVFFTLDKQPIFCETEAMFFQAALLVRSYFLVGKDHTWCEKLFSEHPACSQKTFGGVSLFLNHNIVADFCCWRKERREKNAGSFFSFPASQI